MWGKRADTIVHESDPYNAEPTSAALSESAQTPVDTFYSRNHGPIPDLDSTTWRLQVDGLVESPLSLSLDELRADFEPHEVVATMQCAGNRRAGFFEVRDVPGEDPWRGGAIGTARWSGVRLRDVLQASGPTDAVSDVAFTAPDVSQIADPPAAYGSSIDLAKALHPDSLLAWEMNGEQLSRVHGGPVRVVVPGYIGARSVKWVQGVHLQDRPSDNYFQATAYRLLAPDADPAQAGPGDGISLGPWSLNCEILRPGLGDSTPPGRVEVAGYAVAAEHRRVARVEVSVDDGATWRDAVLDADTGPWTWRRWHVDLEVGPGARAVLARAWDDSGALQPRDAADLWNPKGYANTSWPRVGLTVG